MTGPHQTLRATVGVIDDAFVERAAAGLRAGADDEGAVGGDGGLFARDGVFVEAGGGGVANDLIDEDLVLGEVEAGHGGVSVRAVGRIIEQHVAKRTVPCCSAKLGHSPNEKGLLAFAGKPGQKGRRYGRPSYFLLRSP